MKHIKIIGYTFVASLFMAACAEDITVGNGTKRQIAFEANAATSIVTQTAQNALPKALEMKTDDGKSYYINVSISDGIEGASVPSISVMRGAENKASGLQTNGFAVSAYKHASGSSVGTPDFFYNIKTNYNSSDEYYTPGTYYWPMDGNVLTFLAHYPQANATAGLTLSDASTANTQTITYVVPTSAANQPDLLTAKLFEKKFGKSGVDDSGTTAFTFTHALAAVRFEIGTIPNGTITSIQLKKIKSSGTYTYTIDNSNTVGSWTFNQESGTDITSDFTLASSDMNNNGSFTAAGDLSKDDCLLMMIPQSFSSDDSKIIVSYTDTKGGTHTTSASLKDTSWEAGNTVIYTIGTAGVSTFKAVYPSGANKWSGTEQGPVSTYQLTTTNANEAFGMYVVNGTDIVYSNIKMTVTGEGATATLTPTEASKYFFSNSYKYFIYYPYKDDSWMSSKSVTFSGSNNASADAFFTSLTSRWSVETDQRLETNFRKSDLQVASGIPSSNTLELNMSHKMGLAMITLGTKTVKESYTEYVPASGGTSGASSASKTITASNKFAATCNPYVYSGKYLFITNPGVNKTFSTTSTGITKWNDFNINPTAGNYVEKTAEVAWDKNFYYYVWMYSYSGNYQTFSTANTGTGNYTMQCWGASGGMHSSYTSHTRSGYGGYTAGTIRLTGTSTTLYVYVGGTGDVSHYNLTKTAQSWNNGGWNGGGYSGSNTSSSNVDYTAGGGGSTDIRINRASATTSVWNDFSSLKSRIMVAAGGGGAVYCNSAGSTLYGSNGGDGGGLTGGKGIGKDSWVGKEPTGGGQNIPGESSPGSYSVYLEQYAFFGYASQQGNGGPTTWSGAHAPEWWAGGGGGGWYGGGKGGGPAGAGGSSYISGHSGCYAIVQSSTSSAITHYDGQGGRATSAKYNDSDAWVFTGTSMISGSSSSMPKPTGGTGVGWSGNGYAKITFNPIED